MDKIQPSEDLGFMVLTGGDRLADSGGDLKDKSRVANIMSQVRDSLEISSNVLEGDSHSLTIQFDDYHYVLALEPRRSFVVKRRKPTTADDV